VYEFAEAFTAAIQPRQQNEVRPSLGGVRRWLYG
jgi:hypothetical protein